MKIINRRDFLKLPSCILYQKYSSLGNLENLEIKLDSLENDWYYQKFPTENINPSDELFHFWQEAESGAELKMVFNEVLRDGSFDQNQRFLVWDKEEIKQLVGILQGLLLTI